MDATLVRYGAVRYGKIKVSIFLRAVIIETMTLIISSVS